MSSLDTLSDSELRTRLLQLGYQVGPVTQTTRKILLKKLKTLTEKNTGSRFSMSTAKFSSDETDDEISSSLKKKKKTPISNRRQTLATTMPPPASTISPSRSQSKRRMSTTRTYNTVDSETSDNELPSPISRSPPKRSPSKDKASERANKTPVKNKSLDNLETGSDSDINGHYTSFTSPRSTYLSSSTKSYITSSLDNGHYTSYTSPRTYPSSSSMTYVTSSLDKTQRDKTYRTTSNIPREEVKNSQNMISMLLVAVVVLFFGILFFAYLGFEAKTEFPLSPTESNLPLCTTTNIEQNKPGISCVPEGLIKETIDLLKSIYPILMRKALGVKCESSTDNPHMSDQEIVNLFSSSNEDESKIKEVLRMAYFLIMKNPQWKLNVVEIPNVNSASARTVEDMNDFLYLRLGGNLGIEIRNPDIPWQCQMKNKLLGVFTSALLAAIVGLVFITVRKVILSYVKHKEKKEKEVFNLVTEIMNMLEAHHQNNATAGSPGGSQESYLAINHIRDNLISPKDRKRMNGLWEKAVKFLDENESRIRKEVQLVAGEEFQVWRWLPNNATSNNSNTPRLSSAPKMSKVWQGSAFETMDGSVNSPSCPPTPCLKIRHMFDPDVEFEDDWETKVKDAILEKCDDNVNILHIKVDRGSREGCVYIKCMTQDDAGQAYKALHGSWFDGHLVTVKYLRLERYHERFPEAVNFKIPLKPSNNKRLSMQANTWSNASDAN